MEKQLKFNRGDVAEGILGAAMAAKFINRPKSLKDKNIKLTKQMIDKVLDDLFKNSMNHKEYKVKDIIVKQGKISIDKIDFTINLPIAAADLLSSKEDRRIVYDLYESSIEYIEETWINEILIFAINGEIDKIGISSDGVGDQKGTKADIKLKVNGKDYSRQISLKVKGGDQFFQVSGHEFEKQITLWSDILKLDISKMKKKYDDALSKYDKSEFFLSREDKRVEAVKDMLKNATSIVYREAAKQMQAKVKSKDDIFFTNLATIIFHGATKGNETIELVKLEKGKFKQLKFNKDFVNSYSDVLKKNNLKIMFVEGIDPVVRVYANSVVKDNLIIQFRTKIATESTTTKAGKKYSPYLRNIVESGPSMFSLSK
jgi:hypothetical protein